MRPADIKPWRARHGLTQSQLAQLLGVDVQTVSRYERDERPMPKWLPLALRGIEKSRKR